MMSNKVMDSILNASKEFSENERVTELLRELEQIHSSICNKHVDFDDEDFSDTNDSYYLAVKEDVIDEISVFDYFWFNNLTEEEE